MRCPIGFADRIWRIRIAEAGCRTLGDVANLTGYSYDYIACIARGRIPGAKARAIIAARLGTSPAELWPLIASTVQR
jgi:lambda repressor-like predicted transcriptional regulator